MKHENNYDILLADALHSSDNAARASKISFRRYPFEDILSKISFRRYPIEQMQRSAQTISHRSCLASDFVVLVLSPPRRTVLSETVLVLDGGSRKLADQKVGLLYWIDSSTRKRTNKVVNTVGMRGNSRE